MTTTRPPALRSWSTFVSLLAVVGVAASASGPPKVQEFKFPSLLSLEDTAIVSCVVRKGSHGPYKLVWLKDGKRLEPLVNGNVLVSHQGDSISTLTLKDIAVEDNGNYTCVATNDAGSGEASALLAVTGGIWQVGPRSRGCQLLPSRLSSLQMPITQHTLTNM
ncbi:hypothetical protein HPB50_006460 [Hyalomma asiaticum]|uniref:Uncharacterized protein n=1 Tax=Hyalomma asiaticum TaxID=266040 RepID=A0ACB7RI55_HYAAI|nr:hypothetical protein HPB50_006460 [Hyalomma asiaticum]